MSILKTRVGQKLTQRRGPYTNFGKCALVLGVGWCLGKVELGNTRVEPVSFENPVSCTTGVEWGYDKLEGKVHTCVYMPRTA